MTYVVLYNEMFSYLKEYITYIERIFMSLVEFEAFVNFNRFTARIVTRGQ